MELSPDEYARLVRRAAETLAGAAGRLDRADPGRRAFAGSGGGSLGDVGRDLHDRYVTALAARGREAAAQAARLDDLAAALREAADRLRGADAASARRLRGTERRWT
jgi:hypothetical protein